MNQTDRINAGFRYVVTLPMGYQSAVFTSDTLYRTRGQAIDAGLQAYPQADYPDAQHAFMADTEPIDPADDQLCGDCGCLLGDEPHADDCSNMAAPDPATAADALADPAWQHMTP